MRTAVVIMSKIPQPGFSKTRLNTVLSEQESADFHRACLIDICRAVKASQLQGYIYYLPAAKNPDPAGDRNPAADQLDLPFQECGYFPIVPQQGVDLGERLYLASKDALSSYEAVILLGSDTPVISAELILEAQVRLLSNDVVIGPACDGGYYLLAIKQDCPDIFRAIPWSTDQVLAKTMAVVRQERMSCSLLLLQSDIDNWADLLKFYQDGQTEENRFYQDLEAYQRAARLVQKYGPLWGGELRVG